MNAIINILLLIKSFLLEMANLPFAGRFSENLSGGPEFKIPSSMLLHGDRSLLLVAVTGFIIGLVFTLQSRPTLLEFGAVSWMPSMVSISIIRE
jgi:phospholipid/cholesterol/gamma-HCH transport system permease protein